MLRNNKLQYIMESVVNGQMEQAVHHVLLGCKTRPDKILHQFHTLLTTEEGDRKDILRLMQATAKKLEE